VTEAGHYGRRLGFPPDKAGQVMAVGAGVTAGDAFLDPHTKDAWSVSRPAALAASPDAAVIVAVTTRLAGMPSSLALEQ
jgi:hypothetical protein